MSISGSCMCGRIRFQFTSSLWCAHCHCHDCRAAHGAAFVTWVGVASAQFEIAEGRQHLRWYESSPGARRGFCEVCGTTLLFQAERWPDEMHVTRASIRSQLDREPTAEVYYDRKVDWFPVAGLKRCGGPSGTEPL